MPAYWIARSKVNDAVAYQRYAELVPDIVRSHQGRFLARGGACEVLEGTKHFERFVVIEFPTLELARACHDSPAYRHAASFRQAGGAGEVEIAIVDGVPVP